MGVLQNADKVLGMNARNLGYIRRVNKRKAVQLARNKLATKERLLEAGLPTAKLYGVIEDRNALLDFDWATVPSSVVLKPNFGLGGNGIKIFYGKNKLGHWISGSGEIFTIEDLSLHVNNILDGNFSISNIPDIAYFEERLRLDETFKGISYKGIPDIRVIVYNSVPVMAMLRLPTKASDGKANLQMGGIGVGIDLATGVTTHATSKKHGTLSTHPDFNTPLRGVAIPRWNEMLRISIAAQRAIGLGYAGIDIVLDKNHGPMVLEVNGHPGLGIQNANLLSLRDRLERVSGLTISSIERGLNICQELFGDDSADAGKAAPKPVLGVFESVAVQDASGKSQTLRAHIDTGIVSTTITKDVARRLGFQDVITALDDIVFPTRVNASTAKQVEEEFSQSIKGLHPRLVNIAAVRTGNHYVIRPKIELDFTLGKQRIHTEVAIALDNSLSHPMVIGRREARNFLVDPAKTR